MSQVSPIEASDKDLLIELQSRNVALILQRDSLISAIKNHNLNCQLAIEVDKQLWEILKEVEESLNLR